MQSSSREMQGSAVPQIVLNDRHNGEDLQGFQNPVAATGGVAGYDDFFQQMLSGLPTAWSELGDASAAFQKLLSIGITGKPLDEEGTLSSGTVAMHYGGTHNDESSLLAARLQHNQIDSAGGSSPTGRQMIFQLSQHQQMLLHGMGRSSDGVDGDSVLLPLPLTLGSGGGSRDEVDALFTSPNSASGEGLYEGYGGSTERAAEAPKQQPFHSLQSYGGNPQTVAGVGQAMESVSATTSAGVGTAPPRQRVRARRGQATDPHSIAERLRRERIAERMKALQELVPNANKTDKASMLDEIIDYVKFLQLQVKVLSMSRLGGAAAVAPLVADMSSESDMGRSGANAGMGSNKDGSLAVAEHQVAKLMEEDVGSAMQYLQGKGLCLMPTSLASAISSPTCHPRPPRTATSSAGHLVRGSTSRSHPVPQLTNPNAAATAAEGGDGRASPVVSVLTARTAMADGDISRWPGNKDNPTIT